MCFVPIVNLFKSWFFSGNISFYNMLVIKFLC